MDSNRARQIVECLEACRGTEIYAEEARISAMLNIVQYNRNSLETAYQKLQSDSDLAGSRSVPSERQDDFLQSLFNYLSSLYALYKHGNRYKKKFYCTHEMGTASCDDCNEDNVELLRQTGVLPDWGFVKKLRVYVNHYRLPLLRNPITYVGDTVGQENLFALNSANELVVNDRRYLVWSAETDNGGADGFVEERSPIRVIEVCLRLYESLNTYYERFLKEIRERNAEDIEEHDSLVRELRASA